MKENNSFIINKGFDFTILSSIPGVGVFAAYPNPERTIKWININFLFEYNLNSNIKDIDKLIIPSQASIVKNKIKKFLKNSQDKYEISYSINTKEGIKRIKEIGAVSIENNEKIIYGILIDLSIREKISKKIQSEIISDIHKDISSIYKNDVNNVLAGIDNIMVLLKDKMELIGEAYEENPTWRDIKKIENMLKQLQTTVDFALSFNNKKRKHKPVDVVDLIDFSIKTVQKIYNLNIIVETYKKAEKDSYCFLSPEMFVEIFILSCKTIYEILKLRKFKISISSNEKDETVVIVFKLFKIEKNIVFTNENGLKRFINYPIESTIVGYIKGIGGSLISSYHKESKEQDIIINLPKYKGNKLKEFISIPQGNGETILLVDDDKIIRKSTSKMLENLGYNIISARNGFEAEKIFYNSYDIISLIILDIIMPERDGYQTATAIKRIKENVNLLFMTGFENTEKKRQHEDIEIISKPFSLSELANMVRKNILK